MATSASKTKITPTRQDDLHGDLFSGSWLLTLASLTKHTMVEKRFWNLLSIYLICLLGIQEIFRIMKYLNNKVPDDGVLLCRLLSLSRNLVRYKLKINENLERQQLLCIPTAKVKTTSHELERIQVQERAFCRISFIMHKWNSSGKNVECFLSISFTHLVSPQKHSLHGSFPHITFSRSSIYWNKVMLGLVTLNDVIQSTAPPCAAYM